MEQQPVVTTAVPSNQVLNEGTVAGGAPLARVERAREPLPLVPKSYDDLFRIAKALVDSNLLPDHLRGNLSNLQLIILTGAELGFSPAQATRELYVVKGNVRESALSMLARVQASPLCEFFEVLETTGDRCKVRCKRVGGRVRDHEYTLEDAKMAGLIGRETRSGNTDNWTARRKLMLRRRAISELLQEEFADVPKGMRPMEDDIDQAAAEKERALEVTSPMPPPAMLRRVDEPASVPESGKKGRTRGEEPGPKADTTVKVASPAAKDAPKVSEMELLTERSEQQRSPEEQPAPPTSGELTVKPSTSEYRSERSLADGLEGIGDPASPEGKNAYKLAKRIEAASNLTEINALIEDCKKTKDPYRNEIGKMMSTRRKQIQGAQ